MVTNSDDQLKQLASRLDHIERILQSQIQRIHAVESRLGVTSIPCCSIGLSHDSSGTSGTLQSTMFFPCHRRADESPLVSPRHLLPSPSGHRFPKLIGKALSQNWRQPSEQGRHGCHHSRDGLLSEVRHRQRVDWRSWARHGRRADRFGICCLGRVVASQSHAWVRGNDSWRRRCHFVFLHFCGLQLLSSA